MAYGRSVSISVLTLNLWNDSEPFEERMACIRGWLRSARPDLIGFQEIVRGEPLDQFEILLSELGYETAFGPVVTFWKRDDLLFGNGIASRWPISRDHNTLLPLGDSTEQRGLLCAHIDSPWGTLSLSCSHLDNRSPDNRRLQAKVLAEHLARESQALAYPAILVGDLNAEAEAPELEALMTVAHDACAGIDPSEVVTWSRENPNTAGAGPNAERLDYILVERGLARVDRGLPVRTSAVLNWEQQGVWPSDHFGLVAELATPGD